MLAGMEKVNGQTTYHLRGAATNPDSKLSFQESYWRRAPDVYPAHHTLDTTEGLTQRGAATYSNWDRPVTIDIPNV
jgi:hypothetical protein